MYKKISLVIFTSLLLLLTACGSNSKTTNQASEGTKSTKGNGPIKIAYMVPSLDISYWQWVKYGVEETAKKAGVEVSVYNSNNSPAEQAANVKTALTRGVNGIVLSPVSSTSAPNVLDPAEKSGVPVTFAAIGPDPKVKNYTSLITSDSFNSGYAAGKYLAELVKKNGGNQIGVLSLPLDRTNAQQKKAGLEKACKEVGVEIVQVLQTSDLTVGTAVKQAKDLLTAHPGLKGIYGMYDNAGIGAVRALTTANKKGQVSIVSSDGSPETISYIRDGSIAGIVVQQAVGQGINATEQVIKSIKGEKVEKEMALPEPLITKENIGSSESQKILESVYPSSVGSH